MLVYATTNGILTYTLPQLHPELIKEFGWNEAQVTLPATIYLIVTAITSPPAGFLLDRFSTRRIIAVGLVFIVFGLAAYSQVNQLSQLIVVYILLGSSLSLCGLVSNMLIVTRWFHRERGFATGILLTASSLGGAVFPQIMGFGLEQYGWRDTMLIIAVLATITSLVPLLLLVRNYPKNYNIDKPSVKVTLSEGIRLRDAIREPRFYLVAIATASVWFGLFAMINHQTIFIGRDLGLGKSLATVMTVFALCSIVGKLAFGFLSDKLNKQITMMLAVFTFIIALVILKSLDTRTDLIYVYAAAAGIGFSGTFTMSQVLIAKIYAGASYGKILGTFIMIDTMAGAMGTQAAGILRHSFGSYVPAFDVLIGGCVLSIASLAILRWHENRQPALSNG